MRSRLMLALCAIAIVPALVACGDDDDSDDGGVLSTPGATGTAVTSNNTTASPKVAAPASKYAVSIEDLGLSWITDISQTFVITEATYARTMRLFTSEAEGKRLLKEWGYEGGYETAYIPEGRDIAVRNGAYYISVESHLFENEAGAQKAYDHFTAFVKQNPGAQPIEMATVGNASVAYVTVFGKIADSQVSAVYHHVVSRRGNLVTIVLTKGAEGFMKVDTARSLAAISDAKALGEHAAIEPTPTSNYTPPAGSR